MSGVSVGRLSPALALETTGRFDALEGRWPRSPTIRAHGNQAWATWREEADDDEDRTFAVRLAQLDDRGAPLGASIDEIAEPYLGPALHVSPLGPVLLWGELRDREAPANEVGVQAIVLRRATPEGEVVDRLEIPTTSLDYGEAYDAVTVRGGRVLLVAWGATREGGANGVIYLARFDCVAA